MAWQVPSSTVTLPAWSIEGVSLVDGSWQPRDTCSAAVRDLFGCGGVVIVSCEA